MRVRNCAISKNEPNSWLSRLELGEIGFGFSGPFGGRTWVKSQGGDAFFGLEAFQLEAFQLDAFQAEPKWRLFCG
jgi:hypothetical protein